MTVRSAPGAFSNGDLSSASSGCAAGEVAVGGGYSTSLTSSVTGSTILGEFPTTLFGHSTWVVNAVNDTGAQVRTTVFAVCVKTS